MAQDNDPQADAVARGDVLEEQLTPEPEPEKEVEAAAAPEKEVPEPEPEKEAEAAAAKESDEDNKEPRIPKSRFDQAVQRERERAAQAEAALKQYREREKQQQDAHDFEASRAKIKEMLKEHSSLLADGDLEKASDVMENVLQLRDDMQNARMTMQANNARDSAKIEVKYDATVSRLEAEYPEINPDADEFDESTVRRVRMMVTGLMQNEGKNPADALQEATDILLKPAKEAKGATLRDKPSEEAVESGLRRTQQQISKNLKAAEQQPPVTAAVGQDHDKTGGALDAEMVSKMSWDEFVKVPDEELAKMRGDFIQ